MTLTTTRPRPDDFVTTYIEIGMDGCQEYYRAHRVTVRAWCVEVGLEEIRAARADYVAQERAKRAQAKRPKVRKVRVDPCPPDPYDLRAACAYLRENRNGGWRVGLRDDGNYFVGTKELVGSEVVAMALVKGMDEWYVERDAMKNMREHEGVDEWVLGNV